MNSPGLNMIELGVGVLVPPVTTPSRAASEYIDGGRRPVASPLPESGRIVICPVLEPEGGFSCAWYEAAP
jgi:hypothetical protein